MPALFTDRTLGFLIENRMRNDKDWFNDHKAEYQRVIVEPFISLVESLTPALLKIDDALICSPKIDGSISRIWRDTRFAKDKSIFRDNAWCMFVRQKGLGLPEFFFVIGPDQFLYGCGYYAASTQSMDCIRKLILTGDADFKAALHAYEQQDMFQLDGAMYKKSRHPDAPENLRAWLDRKELAFIRSSKDFDLLYSDKLSDTVAEGFALLAPIYHFLIRAEERVQRQA